MLRKQYLGPNRFQRVYDPRRAKSDLRWRGNCGHDHLFVHSRPLFVTDYDFVGHFCVLPIQVSGIYESKFFKVFFFTTSYNFLGKFWFYRELKCLRNKIHSNLMASYLLAGIMWILNYTVSRCFRFVVQIMWLLNFLA